jgi:DNA-directed RNA polymerase subunit RPC12/RpoP
MNKERVPLSPCPHCGKKFDGASPAFDKHAKPKEGDLSVCSNCGAINQYAENLALTTFPPEDFSLLPIETRNELTHVQKALRQIWTNKK